MDQELFNPQSSSVSSSRIIYTPSTFARTSLLHLQEVGSLQAVHPHISQREDLVSFLCFIVLSGEGTLSYEEQTYQLDQGDCVFIDCRKAYSHSTSDNLWSLQWCHFYAPSLPAVYEKYKERGGQPVFHPDDLASFTSVLTDLYDLASSSDYIRDMRINEKLGSLLTLLMEQSWHPESVTVSRKRMELAAVKEYLDEHYTEKLTLDDLAENAELASGEQIGIKILDSQITALEAELERYSNLKIRLYQDLCDDVVSREEYGEMNGQGR